MEVPILIARQIHPEEIKRTEELFSISFDSPYNNEDTPLELYNKYITHPQNREQEHSLERFAAFEDDNKTMMSCFIMQPFSIRFDGHNTSMFSIGGVATLPQYRKRGGIRACFEKALPYLYKNGISFSYLYPFSTAYYRKFGYELCGKKEYYQVALSHIPAFSLEGSCYLLDASTREQAANDIPAIYDAWQQSYNMMVQSVPYDYNFIQTADPYKEQTFTYVYRSKDNTPLAYMTFRNNTALECRRLECSHFFYINKEGLQGLLALAKTFASDYRHICFSLPTNCPLEQTLPEWSMGAVTCQTIPNGMIRVINVKKTLELAAYCGSGVLTLEITDPYISENNKIFKVDFSESACKSVTVYEKDTPTESADISLSINAFSALIAGVYDIGACALFSDVVIYKNREMISKVFYKKPVYITTSF